MSYIERKTAPAKSNKNYYSKKNVFYPRYVGNCTWYAHGRTLELGYSVKEIPTSNAENWYKKCKCPKGQIPVQGAIACWSQGVIGKGADGAGHVSVVEEVYSDESFLSSEFGKKSGFFTKKHKPPYSYGNHEFEGFIYPIGCNIDNKPEPIPEPQPQPQPIINNEIKPGDSVIVNGKGTASSNGTGAKTTFFLNRTMKVILVNKNAKHPYALNKYNKGTPGKAKDVTAWFSKDSVKKV